MIVFRKSGIKIWLTLFGVKVAFTSGLKQRHGLLLQLVFYNRKHFDNWAFKTVLKNYFYNISIVFIYKGQFKVGQC